MTYRLTIRQEPSYLHVIVTGTNSWENVQSYLVEIMRECMARRAYRVLIEERLEGPRLGTMDVYQIAAEGADLGRVVVGHSNPIATDLAFMKRLLDRGVYLQFDMLGRAPRVNDRNKVSDTQVANAIVGLIAAGYLDRILVAQDVCTKIQLKAYGGFGYVYLHQHFLPTLRTAAVGEGEIRTMTIDNPARILTIP